MNSVLPLCVFLGFVTLGAQPKPPPFQVAAYVTFSQPVSPEGFVDATDKWLVDSVKDLTKALDGQFFHPNKGFPGSLAQYRVVADPAKADLTLTVAARGVSSEAWGNRTTLQIYRGAILADTVPVVGVTRWVSMVLSVETYKKEIVAWSTNRSRFSAGAWTEDAKRVALEAAVWVMANETKIRERQQARIK